MRLACLLPLLLSLPTLSACATWQEDMQTAIQILDQQPAARSALTNSDILAGLKEALAQGTTRAIASLGRTDGYWANLGVRIPLPDTVSRIEKTARKFGQGALVDQFHVTLNRAAEQAVPQVADIFGNAVRRMTMEDVRAILNGPDDAATQFFRRTAGEAIAAKVLPIVQHATQQVGVTQQYKGLMKSYGPMLQLAGVPMTDLDSYVTGRALDGLFATIAAEEARIRADPAARGSEILRRVFGGRGG